MRIRVLFMVVACLAFVSSSLLAQEEDEYRLGEGDVIQVYVWGRPDLTVSTGLNLSGEVRLPLLGALKAEGYTLAQLSVHLTERYQLLDPSITGVTLSVAEYNSQRVTVVGAVRSPGRYSFAKLPDLWAILLTAGGATPDADLGQVQIIHSEEEEGFPRTVTVDLSRGIEDTPLDSLATLQSKDTIVVPSLGARVGSEDKIQVLGAVRSPGAYSVKAAETVIEALSISGGPLPNADLRKVRITRPTSTGAISYQLDLYGYLHEAKPVANLELKTGDTITVPSKGRSLGTVLLDTIRLAPVITSMVSLILVLK